MEVMHARTLTLTILFLLVAGCTNPAAPAPPREGDRGGATNADGTGAVPDAPPEPVDATLGSDRTTVRLERGIAAFNVTSDGPIAIDLLDESGRRVVGLVNSEGPVSTEALVRISSAGVHSLRVTSDATWSVHV